MKSLLLAVALAGSVIAALAMPVAAIAQPGQAPAKTVSAKSLLASLRVAAPDRAHRYDRDRFGYDEGLDADGDGCFTRKEVLIRDHIGAIHVSPSCSVRSTWRSLYDGRVTSVATSLEIDHLVPLAEAWHAGAWKWPHQRQIAFGNDVDYRWDLQAVTAKLNQDKGDKDPARWMPRKNRCTYAEAWVGVKARWHLSVDRAEKAALSRILASCGSARVLKPGKPDLARLAGTRSAASKPVVTPVPVPAPVVAAPIASTAPVPVSATPSASAAPEPVPIAAAPVMTVPVSAVPVSAPPVEMSTPAPSASTAPEPVATALPVASPTPSAAPAVYYANCDAVRAAGAAPLRAGQPGYRSGLDRDGDGVACER